MNVQKNKLKRLLQGGKGVLGVKKRRIIKACMILILCFIIGIKWIYAIYPMPYQAYVLKSSQKYGIDPMLIYSVMKVESKFNPQALSRKGAKGLMQIMDATGSWVAELLAMRDYSHEQLFDPSVNIEMGTWYLSRLMQQYGGDMVKTLAAYNAGSGNVAKWCLDEQYSLDGKTLVNIPFKETKDYIKKVDNNYKIYKYLYQKLRRNSPYD